MTDEGLNTPTEETDVEGHRNKDPRGITEEDVEGHRNKDPRGDDPDDDVEGHRNKDPR